MGFWYFVILCLLLLYGLVFLFFLLKYRKNKYEYRAPKSERYRKSRSRHHDLACTGSFGWESDGKTTSVITGIEWHHDWKKHVNDITCLENECYQRAWSFERIEYKVERGHYLLSFSGSTNHPSCYLLYRREKLPGLSSNYSVRILRFGVTKAERKQGTAKKVFYFFLTLFPAHTSILLDIPKDGSEDPALGLAKSLGLRLRTCKEFGSETPWGTGNYTFELQREKIEVEGFDNHS